LFDTSNFDIWTRAVIPVVTFVLGAVVTFLVQRYWRKRDAVAESAKALAELTADWYNQLDTLRKDVNQAGDTIKATQLVDAYVHSRLILPRALYHIAVLRERNAHAQLVSCVEAFLSSVTSYNNAVTGVSLTCRDLFRGRPTDQTAIANFLTTMQNLDAHQQAVAREAARIE
jgi:hypothetical protein